MVKRTPDKLNDTEELRVTRIIKELFKTDLTVIDF